MDVILLQKVANLGNIGDRVKVRSGYGRNFLLPEGKATLATPDNVARFEARRERLVRGDAKAGSQAVAERRHDAFGARRAGCGAEQGDAQQRERADAKSPHTASVV